MWAKSGARASSPPIRSRASSSHPAPAATPILGRPNPRPKEQFCGLDAGFPRSLSPPTQPTVPRKSRRPPSSFCFSHPPQLEHTTHRIRRVVFARLYLSRPTPSALRGPRCTLLSIFFPSVSSSGAACARRPNSRRHPVGAPDSTKPPSTVHHPPQPPPPLFFFRRGAIKSISPHPRTSTSNSRHSS